MLSGRNCALMAQLRPLSSIEVRTETELRTHGGNCNGLLMCRASELCLSRSHPRLLRRVNPRGAQSWALVRRSKAYCRRRSGEEERAPAPGPPGAAGTRRREGGAQRARAGGGGGGPARRGRAWVSRLPPFARCALALAPALALRRGQGLGGALALAPAIAFRRCRQQRRAARCHCPAAR